MGDSGSCQRPRESWVLIIVQRIVLVGLVPVWTVVGDVAVVAVAVVGGSLVLDYQLR